MTGIRSRRQPARSGTMTCPPTWSSGWKRDEPATGAAPSALEWRTELFTRAEAATACGDAGRGDAKIAVHDLTQRGSRQRDQILVGSRLLDACGLRAEMVALKTWPLSFAGLADSDRERRRGVLTPTAVPGLKDAVSITRVLSTRPAPWSLAERSDAGGKTTRACVIVFDEFVTPAGDSSDSLAARAQALRARWDREAEAFPHGALATPSAPAFRWSIQRTGQQVFLLDRLRAVARINA